MSKSTAPLFQKRVAPIWQVIPALLVVVGLSALIGFLGSDEGFSWELASIFGTAAGTTLLAAATYWLGYSTKQEQAARERPVVLQEDAGSNGSPQGGYVKVTLFNAGLGPALRVYLRATYEGHDDWKPTIESKIVPAIAPNEHGTVRLRVWFPEPNRPGGPLADTSWFLVPTSTARARTSIRSLPVGRNPTLAPNDKARPKGAPPWSV